MSADYTTGLKRIGQRGATSKTYAGWHEFAKGATPYALFREGGDADAFASLPNLIAERDALAAALRRCAQGWGWWNPERPPIVAELPVHPAVEDVIAAVEREERARYAAEERQP